MYLKMYNLNRYELLMFHGARFDALCGGPSGNLLFISVIPRVLTLLSGCDGAGLTFKRRLLPGGKEII